MTFVNIIFGLLAVAILTTVILLFQFKSREAPMIEPLDISGWVKVDKTTAIAGGFILNGDAINYGNGRPYKLHLKKDSSGEQVWYAEFIDKDELYKTDIGKK